MKNQINLYINHEKVTKQKEIHSILYNRFFRGHLIFADFYFSGFKIVPFGGLMKNLPGQYFYCVILTHF